MKFVLCMAATAVAFLLLILLLAIKPSLSKKVTGISLAIAGISGLLIYSYGYLVVTDNFILAILKALLAVAGSFIGSNKFGDLDAVPIMNTPWMKIFCTAMQVCALYTTASAVITSLGTEALKRMRLWFSRRKNLHLIYGTHEDALRFGRELAKHKEGILIFVSESAGKVSDISSMGAVLLSDSHAVNADSKFLKRIGFGRGRRSLSLYAINRNTTANIHYAHQVLRTAKELDIAPEQLRLVISSREEVAVSTLQGTREQYGYSSVTAVNEPQMAARLLTLTYPPCNTVSFDENGKALDNFEALIIGFGQTGQAVLKSLVMNGQFEGSHFRAAVFSNDRENTDGSFWVQHPQLCKEYDITFYDSDGRSRRLYEYLQEHGKGLKYVVICTGSEEINHEIAEELTAHFRNIGLSIPIYKCSHSAVDAYGPDGTVVSSHKLYCRDVLCSKELDQMAMILNHRYQKASDRTPLQNWMRCDYFSRQSCRAAADFMPAVLRCAGVSREDVINGKWQLTQAQQENLSKTEHLRWCSFHYCMGFSTMEEEEFEARADVYRQQLEKDGAATIRIGKNMAGKTHACLVKWDDLDILSQKEEAVTGKYVDYKAMDTENILATPELLKALAQ